ncbi:MAG TPA: DUF2125 domain-containing protein, partial [Stellaceae bacterium]|nr:DUF2125 domain-containing protein [Stellaceae bacterium]
MRRATVLGLLGAVLVVGIGAYTAFWWVAAQKIEEAATAWRESARAQKIDASWQTMRVAGYPFSLRLELGDVVVKDAATTPPAEFGAPLLSASVSPWNFHRLWFAAPDGLNAAAGPEALAFAKLSAARGSGAAAFTADGTAAIWLTLYQAKAEAGLAVGARAVNAWAIVPASPPASHQDPGFGLAADIRDLTLPAAPAGFKPAIDDLGFGLTMMGAFPPGPLRQAAAAWRDAGGTVELDHLLLRWGDMEINGS